MDRSPVLWISEEELKAGVKFIAEFLFKWKIMVIDDFLLRRAIITFYDENIDSLGQQVARKKQLEAILQELKIQQASLGESVETLEKSKIVEQKDVDKLEKISFSAVFYTIAGKKEEKIDKEKLEAYTARVKYETALDELANVKFEIERNESEYNKLIGCEALYQRALEEKAEIIKESGSADALKILNFEKR